jgi:hypothetical protein
MSGCGFAFAIQEDGEKYSVFLDRSKVYFVVTNEYYEPFSPTRGTGRVNFGNPFDQPVEADFTLIVKGTTHPRGWGLLGSCLAPNKQGGTG